MLVKSVMILSLLILLFSCNKKVKDADGNVYDVVQIGDQCWLKQNLKTAHYNDGTEIPTNLNDSLWLNDKVGACTIYKGDGNTNTVKNNRIYGKLYNWYAVTNKKGIAPKGWHIATEADWHTLRDYLGEKTAGNKLKAKDTWDYHKNGVGNNSTGFSAKAGGCKNPGETFSNDMGQYAYFWTNSTGDCDASHKFPISINISYHVPNITPQNCYNSNFGMSVRCVKD